MLTIHRRDIEVKLSEIVRVTQFSVDGARTWVTEAWLGTEMRRVEKELSRLHKKDIDAFFSEVRRMHSFVPDDGIVLPCGLAVAHHAGKGNSQAGRTRGRSSTRARLR